MSFCQIYLFSDQSGLAGGIVGERLSLLRPVATRNFDVFVFLASEATFDRKRRYVLIMLAFCNLLNDDVLQNQVRQSTGTT